MKAKFEHIQIKYLAFKETNTMLLHFIVLSSQHYLVISLSENFNDHTKKMPYFYKQILHLDQQNYATDCLPKNPLPHNEDYPYVMETKFLVAHAT